MVTKQPTSRAATDGRDRASAAGRDATRRPSPPSTANAGRPDSPAATDASTRIDLVDVARGIAVTTMIAYHVCFDLTYFGWASWRMLDDPGWIAWRDAIVGSFVFVVGVSLALRDARGRGTGRDRWFAGPFVRRWGQIAAAAVLVSIGSFAIFPTRFIYFGVLHFVAVALWVCRRAPRRPMLAALLAIVCLGAGLGLRSPTFDPKPIDWIGFATVKPATEDYVPLFPWLGVVLAGCAAGGWWTRRGTRLSPAVQAAWSALPRPLAATWRTMGRWSLTIYLVHQPLLFAAMEAIHRLGAR